MFLPPRHLHLCHLFVLSHPDPNFLVVVACQGSCYITQTWWLFCVQQSFLLKPPAGNLRYWINLGPVSTSLVARTYFCFYKLTTQLWCSHLNNHLHYYFYKFYKFGVLSSHAQRPPCHCRGSLARPTYQSYFRLSTLPSPPPSTIPTSAINSLPHSYCVTHPLLELFFKKDVVNHKQPFPI